MTGTSGVASVAGLVLDVAIGATLLLGLMALAERTLLRRAPAATRHLAWLGTLAALLVLPLVSQVAPQWRWELPGTASAAVRPAAPSLPASAPLAGLSPRIRVNPVSTGRLPAAGTAVASLPPALPEAAAPTRGFAPGAAPGIPGLLTAGLILWGIGAGGLLLRFAARLRSLHRFAAECLPYPDPAAFELLHEAATLLDTSPGIHLLQAPANRVPSGPMTWGVQEPVVVLPPGALLWPPARMRSVLLHEVAHVKRRDWTGYLLANAVCVLYWFHPLVWWGTSRLRAESELACDDRVLGAGIPATEYAHALVEVIKSLRGPVGGLKVAISMAQGPQIEQRLRAILDPHRRRQGPSPAALTTGAVLLAAAAVPAAGLRVRPAGEAEWSPAGSTVSAPETPATAPRDARVAWGQPAGGLRAGLEWSVWDQEVRPGEVVALRVRLKNTGTQAVRLVCLKPSGWNARLDASGRITLHPLVNGGGSIATQALWLPPGKECFAPGPTPRLRIQPDTAATSGAPGEPVNLPAGRYQIVAARPLMLQGGDPGNGSLFTGLLPLQVLPGSGAPEPSERRNAPAASPTPPRATAIPATQERPELAKLRNELVDAETQLAEQRTQLGEQHPRIQAVRARVASLRRRLTAAPTQTPAQVPARLTEQERVRWRSTVQAQLQYLRNLYAQVKARGAGQAELNDLRAQIKSAEKRHQELTARTRQWPRSQQKQQPR